MRGDLRWDDRLPDPTPFAQRAFANSSERILTQLRQVDPEGLSESMRLNRDLLAYELELRVAAARFRAWQMPVTQMWGPQRWLPEMPDRLGIATDERRAAYLERLRAIPGYLAQVEANMRMGMAAGRVPPRIVVEGAVRQARSQGSAAMGDGAADRHLLFRPFLGRDDAQARAARELVAAEIAPAFDRFADFLADEYLLACRDTLAAADLPDGEAYYSLRVRTETTLDLTPREIHDLGRAEVARIRAEMLDVIRRTEFPTTDAASGLDDHALFARFVEHLRTDPSFYHDSEEALLDGYRVICKRIDAHLPALFRTLPRNTYGVREMAPFIAPSSATAYYYPGSLANGVPGYFVANTYALDQRPKYEMIALSLHEAVPGHHLQIALTQELRDQGLHEWRTERSYTAFGEGGALYAERLGLEMGPPPRGLYADPYDDFGRLSYEMWRAMRLVVDTGIHALGWSRERAIAFMLDNSALARTNVEREVDRYIAWPGQALAYKLGELRIRAIRAQAERRLAGAFDLRDFHDALLLDGPLPLPVLEAKMDRWIDARAEAE